MPASVTISDVTGRAWATARPALIADGLQVGQSMYLSGWFTATGAGKVGAVRLLGAHSGQLDVTGRAWSTTPAPPFTPTACRSARTCTSAAGRLAGLTAVGWVLRLLAWAFAALFIAGFTSAVRKT